MKIKIKVDNKNKITKVNFNEKYSLDDVITNVGAALCLMLKKIRQRRTQGAGLAMCLLIAEATDIGEERGCECCDE